MKSKSVLCFCLFTFIFCLSQAQVPKGFNYQAVALDGSAPIESEITVRITIQSGPSSGIIWVEDHTVTPDATGLFNLVIGKGAKVVTSTVDTFDDINWAVSELYIKTEIDYGGWKTMGSVQLWSVPYAMVAETAYNGIGNPFTMNGDTVLFSSSVGVGATNLHKAKLAVSTDKVVTDEDPLFEVRRSDGKPVFSVYNEGVRISVADRTSKGAKGGFAIGGFATSKEGETLQEYLTLTPYAARINMNEPLTKAAKGGFAIGGFTSKGPDPTNFLDITPKNYFIGHESGTLIDGGLYNSVVGYQAGKGLIGGSSNTIFGNTAGLNISSGDNNIVIGSAAGYSMNTGIHNTLIGSSSGYSLTNQQYNIMIGTSAGYHINANFWEGSFNTFLGINAGYQIRNSKENVFLGTNAGYWLDNGLGNTFIGIDAGRSRNESGEPWTYRSTVNASYNTFIGDKTGYNITNGDNNVAIGYMSGYNNADGIGNVFIGNLSGYSETGSNKLYIHNSAVPSTDALIYGEFDNSILRFNASVGINIIPNPVYKLSVGGDAYISGNLSAAGISASSFTGDVTGSLNGNVAGDVTGNVNGMTMGKIFLTGEAEIASTAGETFKLLWDPSLTGSIAIENSNAAFPCNYWFIRTSGGTKDGEVIIGEKIPIIEDTNIDNEGFEIHFGQADGELGWCSVWIQYYKGKIVGHFIK